MRVIAVFFGLYAPDALTPPVSVFLPWLQGVRTMDKTCNQFYGWSTLSILASAMMVIWSYKY